MHIELAKDIADMKLNGGYADPKICRDPRIVMAAGYPLQHSQLMPGKVPYSLDGLGHLADQYCGGLGGEHR